MKNVGLILVDVQKGFDDPFWGKRNNPAFELNVAKLLDAARKREWNIYLIKHCSTDPNSPLRPELSGCEFADYVVPRSGERIITKTVNSSFIGTQLEKHLRDDGVDTVVIAGLTTDHCVSTTTRMAANLGFKTFLVADAVATFDKVDMNGDIVVADDVHRVNLASLRGEFATLLNTAEALNLTV